MDFISIERLNYRIYAEFPKITSPSTFMHPELLQEIFSRPDFEAFIQEHEAAEVTQLAFQFHGKTPFPLAVALEQIQLRQKARTKIPEWAEKGCFLTAKGLEQCSSSLTATKKAEEVLKSFTRCRLLDCNGGMGVDTWAFARLGASVTTIEQDPWIANLLRINQKKLHQKVEVVQGEVLSWLDQNPKAYFDLVYADPDRRSEAGKRLAHPDQLNPPVSQLLSRLQGRCRQILLKMSPLFDPREGIKILPFVKEVWIISTQHECREILFLIEPGFKGQVSFMASACFQQRWFYGKGIPEFPKETWQDASFLYVTDTAFVLSGLAPNLPGVLARLDRGMYALTQELVEDFPGIPYRILLRIPEKGKALLRTLAKVLPEAHINISAKGSNVKSEELLKALKKKPGGNKLVLIRPETDAEVLLLEKV